MNTKQTILAILATALSVAAVIAPNQQTANGSWRQEWRMEPGSISGTVHFMVERSRPGNNSSSGHDVVLSDFRGLAADPFARGGAAKFEYVHDAGRLLCEGSFSGDRGSGTYTFVPNPAYGAELKRMGYDAPDEDDLFHMLMMDVSLDFARGIRAEFATATLKQLVELRIHGVTLAYVHDMHAAGYKDLALQDFVEMRIHGVTVDFVQDLKRAGYNVPARKIIELRIHGVTSEYVAEMQKAGYRDLTVQDLIDLRIHGVSTEYLQALHTYGLHPTASELQELRIHGVSPEFLKGLHDAGYTDLPARQITEMRIHGVSTEFIQESRQLGYRFTPPELVELRIHGVDGAYLKKLQDAGFKNLSAEQIARLRIHGVD